jgi:hypothetical protein
MFDAPLLLFISFVHFILLTVVTTVRALQIHGCSVCIGEQITSEKSWALPVEKVFADITLNVSIWISSKA